MGFHRYTPSTSRWVHPQQHCITHQHHCGVPPLYPPNITLGASSSHSSTPQYHFGVPPRYPPNITLGASSRTLYHRPTSPGSVESHALITHSTHNTLLRPVLPPSTSIHLPSPLLERSACHSAHTWRDRHYRAGRLEPINYRWPYMYISHKCSLFI